MSQITKKVIGGNQVDGSKIRLNNTQPLKARNAADSGDVDIIKLNSSDEVVLSNGTNKVVTEGSNIEKTGDIIPDGDNSKSIGSSSNRINTVHTLNVVADSGNLSLQASASVVLNGSAARVGSTTDFVIYNDKYLKWRNQLDTSDVEALKMDGNDRLNVSNEIQELIIHSLNGVSITSPSSRLRLANGTWLMLRNAADTADINFIRANNIDQVELGPVSIVPETDLTVQIGSLFKRIADFVAQSITVKNLAGIDEEVDLGSSVLRLNNDSTNPSPAAGLNPGQLYFNTSTNKVRVYDGSSWVEISGGGSPTFANESFTLTASDIANQYIDLATEAVANSILFTFNHLVYWEGVDFTTSLHSGKTRITFAGDLATGGPSELVAGDILRIKYVEA